MSYKHESGVKFAQDIREPKMFIIIMHNDDYTTMEFVIEVLKKIFHKSEVDANNIMLNVHNAGSSLVGIYTYDIAATKKSRADQMASERGFPLKLTIEEAIE